MHGLLAQLGERMGHNHDVAGSSPSQTTIKALKPMTSALFVLFQFILYYFEARSSSAVIKSRSLITGHAVSKIAHGNKHTDRQHHYQCKEDHAYCQFFPETCLFSLFHTCMIY